MPTNPKADQTVEIVGAGGQADYKVQVVGDQVVDLTGATPGDVLVVQADGSLAPQAAVAGGAVDSVTAASAKIVVAGTPTNPTVDVGTGIAQSAITSLVSDLGAKALASDLTAEAATARAAESAKVAVVGHTSNSIPAASGSTSLADLAMGASTILARLAAGNIVAATPDQLKTLLAIAESDVASLTADLAALAPLASPTFTGVATAPSLSSSGKTGATNQATILAGGTASGAPSTGAHVVGELVVDATGAAWYCITAGTPGTWVRVGGSYASIKRTAGNITLNGTNQAVADLVGDGTLDLAIAAATGDRILVELVARCVAASADAYINVGTVVSGSKLNFLAGTGAAFDTVWFAATGATVTVGGAVPYTVVAGDVVAGVVTFRPCCTRDGASAARNISATSTIPLFFSARNVGK